MSAHKITIAIDGYSSCGKSTLARLAVKLARLHRQRRYVYRARRHHASVKCKNPTDHDKVLEAISMYQSVFCL